MRNILSDYARSHQAAKRGKSCKPLPFNDLIDISGNSIPIQLADLNDALEALETAYPKESQIVEYYIFWGLTIGEIAELIEVSKSTVKRDWDFAKAWLYRKMNSASPEERPT